MKVVPPSDLSRRWREAAVAPVTRRPDWLLDEARPHLRQHYPADGLSESVLWALHGIGFDLPGEP